MKTRSRLGALIEEAVLKQDVEKQDLARHLGIRPASFSKWIRQEYPDAVPPLHWEKICAFLSIPWKTWIDAAKTDRPEDVEKYHRLVRSLSGR